MMYILGMQAKLTKPRRVYVQVMDASKRSKSRCLTIYDVTPSEAVNLIKAALRDVQRIRKAG